MRISSLTIYDQMKSAIQDDMSQISEKNMQLFTGKKINKPSDDPAGMVQAMDYKVSLSVNSQYQNNMQSAGIFMSTTDTSLTTSTAVLNNLQQIAASGINSTTQTERDTLSQQAAGNRDTLLDMANTKLGDSYVYSGFKTDQKAFSFNAVTNSYQYNGDLGNIQVPISNVSTMSMNVQGSNTFSFSLGTTMPTALSDGTPVSYTQAKDAGTGVNTITVEIGNAGDPNHDSFTVSNVMDVANVMSSALKNQGTDGAALDASADISQQKSQHRVDSLSAVIDAARTNVLAQQAVLGARQSAMNDQKTAIDQSNLNLENARSTTEDADINSVVVDIQQANVSLDALRSSSASVLAKSLFDYLA